MANKNYTDQNLTKENFWDEMMTKYPVAMDDFCKFIDEYMVKNNWSRLFNPAYRETHISGHAETLLTAKSAPKYHDLPLAMQTGIFFEFMGDVWGCSMPIDVFDFVIKELIEEVFGSIQDQHDDESEVANG